RSVPIVQDARLRECDYGDFEGRPRTEMETARPCAIWTPFPHGESYLQVAERMHSFLVQLAARHNGQQVLLVGHAATLWMLEHWLKAQPLDVAVGPFPERPWRYRLDGALLPAPAVRAGCDVTAPPSQRIPAQGD
ncbi:MAG: histidine phosphatase family protein, partial [Candidatus Tectomicrobia bacterium]|nr:histidine phosphatase family protein [Candidatus Tectomicrobia bacterium]